MGKKKYNNSCTKTKTCSNISNNKIINFISNIKLFNKFNDRWDKIFIFCINYFNAYNYSKNIIRIIKTIHSNKFYCTIFFILCSWFCSNLILKIVYCFMLMDSLIISLLVLQNNCIQLNSRRLAKNVILIALTSVNLIGNMTTLFTVLLIYMEFSKFIGRLLFKFVKFIIKIIGNVLPPIYLLYPDIKLFNFDDPDITIEDENTNINKKNKILYKSSSTKYEKSSDTEYESFSESSSTKIKKKLKRK